MAFRLTKQQAAEINEYAYKLREAREQIEAVLATVNEEMDKLVNTDLLPLIDSYNTLVNEARDYVHSVGSDLRSEYEDKSEAWQEGERGQAANDFITSFEEIDLTEDLQVPDVTSMEIEMEDDADVLEGLPQEAE